MNYFEFYGIEEKIHLDDVTLRTLFRKKSRDFHPDHHSDASPTELARVIQLSTTNNEAYKVLENFESRVKYVLEINGLLGDQQKHIMSPSFLGEMMEINEAIIECEAEGRPIPEEVRNAIAAYDTSLLKDMHDYGREHDEAEVGRVEILAQIKEIFLKRKYILRIQEKIDTFTAS